MRRGHGGANHGAVAAHHHHAVRRVCLPCSVRSACCIVAPEPFSAAGAEFPQQHYARKRDAPTSRPLLESGTLRRILLQLLPSASFTAGRIAWPASLRFKAQTA